MKVSRRAAPEPSFADSRIADTVADCLRDLHAIAAQAAGSDPAQRRLLRLIDGAAASEAEPN